MFEASIMLSSTCVWTRCGCVFGGSGISVTDVDHSSPECIRDGRCSLLTDNSLPNLKLFFFFYISPTFVLKSLKKRRICPT